MKKFIKILLLLVLALTAPLKDVLANEKIKIGLLVPLSGKNSEIGRSIINSTKLAINKINNTFIEIIPKDTGSDPNITLKSAKELSDFLDMKPKAKTQTDTIEVDLSHQIEANFEKQTKKLTATKTKDIDNEEANIHHGENS